MTNPTKEQVLERFLAAGGKYVNLGTEPEADVMRYQCRHDELLAFAAALEERNLAQIAMLRDCLQNVGSSKWWADQANAALSATQQTADAFLAEIEARVLEEFMRTKFDAFFLRLCELPDRNSPDDEPGAIIANRDELHNSLLNTIYEVVAEKRKQAGQESGKKGEE